MADHYQVLGVARDASPEDIKRAFRRLARETHPDANPGDPGAEGRFREVAAAYEVLSDPQRRTRYDRGDTVDIGDLFSGFSGGLDDLLRSVFGEGSMFGGGMGQPRASRGRDILVKVRTSLHDAAFGSDADVVFRSTVRCAVCEGSGSRPGTAPSTCGGCGGTGAQRVARRGILGTMMTVTTCSECGGLGEVVSDPCEGCRGSGVTDEERKVTVEIPAGVDTGTRLRLTGEGEVPQRGGRAGDLFVEIVVESDDRFERSGETLLHRASVGIAEAALGATITVPLLEGGETAVDVPAGTQPGWVTTVSGHGMTRLGRRGRGDLLVEVSVRVPEELSTEQEEILRRFAELDGQSPTTKRRRRR